jgi:hypothetical protein
VDVFEVEQIELTKTRKQLVKRCDSIQMVRPRCGPRRCLRVVRVYHLAAAPDVLRALGIDRPLLVPEHMVPAMWRCTYRRI